MRTKQQTETYIRDLLRERKSPNADIDAIDAELARLGAAGQTPAKRSTKLSKGKAKSGSARPDKS